MLKVLFLLLVVMLIFAGPIAALRRPWAIRLWRRLKLVIFAYVLVIFLVAITRLILNWDQIYG
jgi:hypothetical protein